MCEMPSVYECDRPKARKPHECCECRGAIEVGERYHKHHGIWDGAADTFKVCEDCEALRADIDRDVTDFEFKTPFGYLHESVLNGGDPVFIKRFLDIKRKRGATIQPWMRARAKPSLVGAATEHAPMVGWCCHGVNNANARTKWTYQLCSNLWCLEL